MRLTGTPNWLTIRKGKSPEPGDDWSPTKGPGAGQVWAVGGGKGGIGKSFLVANLGAVAATLGRRVILIDVDLGAANLHTCLGVRGGSRVNLSDYLEDRVADLEKAAIQTPIPGLRLILGALGHVGARETTRAQRSELLRAVRALPADLVILDLAAGTERATLDFFLVSDCSFVVTTPEPTAIENAYGFLRASYYRRLGHALSNSSVRDLLRVAMDPPGTCLRRSNGSTRGRGRASDGFSRSSDRGSYSIRFEVPKRSRWDFRSGAFVVSISESMSSTLATSTSTTQPGVPSRSADRWCLHTRNPTGHSTSDES
jgi:hypothetical protein